MKSCSVKQPFYYTSKLMSLEVANKYSNINHEEHAVDRDCKPFVSQQNECNSFMYTL